MASGVTNIMRHACRAVAMPRKATDCVEARRRDLTFPQSCAIVLPPPLVWRGTLCSLRQDRADGRRHVAIGLPTVFGSPAFLFPAENLTFRVLGVDYVTFFSECIPIPGKVKGRRRRFAPPAFLRPESNLLSSKPCCKRHPDACMETTAYLHYLARLGGSRRTADAMYRNHGGGVTIEAAIHFPHPLYTRGKSCEVRQN